MTSFEEWLMVNRAALFAEYSQLYGFDESNNAMEFREWAELKYMESA